MVQKKAGKAVVTLSLILIFSFLLNYTWESMHAVFLYEEHNFQAEKYIRMLLYVSAIDSLIILLIYLFVAVLWRDMLWLGKMNVKQAITACLAGLIIAAVIEYRKVAVLKEWSYTLLMPTIFGIGLSPLLQLSTTALLTFWVVRKLLSKKGTYQ